MARVLAIILFAATMFFVVWGINAEATRWGWVFPWAMFGLELLAAQWLDGGIKAKRLGAGTSSPSTKSQCGPELFVPVRFTGPAARARLETC